MHGADGPSNARSLWATALGEIDTSLRGASNLARDLERVAAHGPSARRLRDRVDTARDALATVASLTGGRTWRLESLPPNVQAEMNTTTEMSNGNDGLHLRLALSYGSRHEIRDAVVRLARALQAGELQEGDVDDETLRRYFYDPDLPDPDLLIRTGGEYRLSNFLLWHASYSEIYVTEVPWPEFTKERLHEAIDEFARRERRYGGIGPPGTTPPS